MVVPLDINDKVWKGLENHKKNFEGRFNAFGQSHNIETGEHGDFVFQGTETPPSSDPDGIKLFFNPDRKGRFGFVNESGEITEFKPVPIDENDEFSIAVSYKPFENVSPESVSPVCISRTVLKDGQVVAGNCFGRNATVQFRRDPVSGFIEKLDFLFQESLKNIQVISYASDPSKALNVMTIDRTNTFFRFSIPINSLSLNKNNFFKLLFIGWG